jgi:hypothetical protein
LTFQELALENLLPDISNVSLAFMPVGAMMMNHCLGEIDGVKIFLVPGHGGALDFATNSKTLMSRELEIRGNLDTIRPSLLTMPVRLSRLVMARH